MNGRAGALAVAGALAFWPASPAGGGWMVQALSSSAAAAIAIVFVLMLRVTRARDRCSAELAAAAVVSLRGRYGGRYGKNRTLRSPCWAMSAAMYFCTTARRAATAAISAG